MRRCSLLPLALLALVAAVACKPGGVTETDKLCARAAAMYERCESHAGMTPQQWELGIDRWRSLCRAAFTGETRQLLPDARSLWNQMADDVKRGLREQALCGADAKTCEQY